MSRITKREAFDQLLQEGDVWVHVNLALPGARAGVPAVLRDRPFVTFTFGLTAEPPMQRELRTTPDKLTAELHFRGAGWYPVEITWANVFALVNREGVGFVDERIMPEGVERKERPKAEVIDLLPVLAEQHAREGVRPTYAYDAEVIRPKFGRKQ